MELKEEELARWRKQNGCVTGSLREQVKLDLPGHTILWVEWPDVKPERQVVGRF